MHWDFAVEILDQIQEASAGDQLVDELRQDLLERAVRYARLRVDWQMTDPSNRHDVDRRRRIAHNALIDACNILSRAMESHGMENSWRGKLGDDRKALGDFACYVHCLLGLAAR